MELPLENAGIILCLSYHSIYLILLHISFQHFDDFFDLHSVKRMSKRIILLYQQVSELYNYQARNTGKIIQFTTLLLKRPEYFFQNQHKRH